MFASNGEKLEDFDVFHPDRMASRILGMGDMLTLIEQAERTFDQAEAEQMAAKLGTGNEFTLEDFLEQLQAIRRMGPISNLLGMLPGMGQMKEAISQVDDRDLDRTAAIIRSMTPAEREQPEDDQRVAPASYRQRFRRLGQRGEQPRRPILRGPQDDAADGRRHGPAGRATEEHQVRERPQGQEGALRIGRGPTPPRTPAGLPRGIGGMPGGLPGGFGSLGGVPPQLPPGTKMPDLSKLKLPKE